MISEGSWDTEDSSNNAEMCIALYQINNFILKLQ